MKIEIRSKLEKIFFDKTFLDIKQKIFKRSNQKFKYKLNRLI